MEEIPTILVLLISVSNCLFVAIETNLIPNYDKNYLSEELNTVI
jgi:hypothetical protein